MNLLFAAGALLSFYATAEVSATEGQRLTASGDAKLAAGNASGAAADYRAAIAADAGAFEARVNLGAAMLKLGDAEGAADSLEAARKVKPDSAPVLRNLGRAYLTLERFEEAAEALGKAREEDPGNQEGVRLAGIAMHRAGRHADAVPLLRQAAAKRADGDLLVELANAEADAGDSAAAAKTVARARAAAGATGTDAARRRNNVGLLLRRLGKNEDALVEFRAAAKADPSYSAALSNLGLALFESGDAKNAVGTLASAAKLDPDPAIRYALGQARLANGDAKNAIDDLLYARSWGYDPRRIAGLLVQCYEARGDAKNAANERARAGIGSAWSQPVTDPGAAKAFEALNQGRYPEAVELLGALVKQPARDNGKAWLGLGYAKFRVGDAPGAVAALESAVKGLPKDVDAWYYLGSAKNAAGDRAGAVAAWRTVLQLAPARADVAANMGRLLVELGRAEDAVEPLGVAAKALPRNLDVQHDYAVALLETGKAAEAAAVLKSYVNARPEDLSAAEARASALGKAGDHKASASAFEWLAKKQPSVSRHALNASVAWRNAANRKNEKWWITRAAALAPDDAKIVAQLARMNFEDGEWDAAVDGYQRAAKLDPSDTSAAQNVETARKNRDLVAMKASRLHLGIIVMKDKAVATRAATDLKKGTKTFADVAKAVSTHESAAGGGDLGWVDPATLPEWAVAAKTLERGKTSGVVEIPGGFAIFSRYAD